MPFEVWLSEEAVADRARLSPAQERKLLWWRDRLRQDPMAGDAVKKSLIPKHLSREYAATNLFVARLPEGWRVLYTLVSRPGQPAEVHILRILPHDAYDQLFGYG